MKYDIIDLTNDYATSIIDWPLSGWSCKQVEYNAMCCIVIDN